VAGKEPGSPEIHVRQAQHSDPVGRARADFIIASAIEPFGPEIDSEQLWARRVVERDFELSCIPFVTYGLALGNVVRTGQGYLVEERIQQSGRAVFRASFSRQGHAVAERVTQQLIERDAQVEWFAATYVTVDARDPEHAKGVEAFLQEQQALGNLEYEAGN
jgi:hypothetical protein